MRPMEVGKEECQASFSREEAGRLGELALNNGDIDMAVTLTGMARVMELLNKQAAEQTEVSEPTEDRVADSETAVDEEALTSKKTFGPFGLRPKKKRGVRRPKEHRMPEFTYGSDT